MSPAEFPTGETFPERQFPERQFPDVHFRRHSQVLSPTAVTFRALKFQVWKFLAVKSQVLKIPEWTSLACLLLDGLQPVYPCYQMKLAGLWQ